MFSGSCGNCSNTEGGEIKYLHSKTASPTLVKPQVQ
jgi:hypothetical protein